ncbi:D-alanine--D-alanine ligase [Sediminitomix flava]|uniref:D-alanine--D-alanine ligase n=1 Tax=Sediminitomix flava TaxID=379075 RepID=A0A315Z7F5_SEDFL|nr:D-alanine--D-alanine ligase [Sediminitomix flava]PWJ40892.1 D-alanine-D-alanine ligase [Sediminitomix flava]
MKKTIAVAMGGYSSEYQISINSGNVVYESLDRNLFEAYRVIIELKSWYVLLDDNSKIEIDKNDFGFEYQGKKITFDGVFNAIHGTPGEDGKLVGYFDMLNIPYTSCLPFEAALTFNKRECNAVAKQYEIPVAESVFLSSDMEIKTDEIIEKVGLPCFVKPNRAGSSFGISKVKTEAELLPAIHLALKEDSQILIESFLEGTEVSVGTMRKDGEVLVLPITEIRSENEFFDYEAKYEGKSQEITPAEISDVQTAAVRELAAKVYQSLNLKGFVRTDFIIVKDQPYLLEVNTIPGLSRASIIPQQVNEMGMTLTEFFTGALQAILA